MRRLRAIFAVFGAAARFNGQQGGKLDAVGIEMGAVDLGSLKHQFHKRQVEQIFHLAFAPVLRGRMRCGRGLAAQGDGTQGGHRVSL